MWVVLSFRCEQRSFLDQAECLRVNVWLAMLLCPCYGSYGSTGLGKSRLKIILNNIINKERKNKRCFVYSELFIYFCSPVYVSRWSPHKLHSLSDYAGHVVWAMKKSFHVSNLWSSGYHSITYPITYRLSFILTAKLIGVEVLGGLLRRFRWTQWCQRLSCVALGWKPLSPPLHT